MGLRLRVEELIERKAKAEGRTLTQKKVAQESAINESTLSRYSNGFVTSFNGVVLEKLADYFEVGIGELFVRSEERTQV